MGWMRAWVVPADVAALVVAGGKHRPGCGLKAAMRSPGSGIASTDRGVDPCITSVPAASVSMYFGRCPMKRSFSMDIGHTAQHWLLRSAPVFGRVASARRRFSASLGVHEVPILAAADELEVATREARAWMEANLCPDRVLGSHAMRLLNTCAEVVRVAQRAITDSAIESQTVLGRLAGLLAVINIQAAELDDW